MHFDTPVKINEITANTVEEIKYDPTRFDFGDLKFDPKATEQLGYAGFRVLYPINKADKQDEIMTMLGASYFRVVGKGHTYGLSAAAWRSIPRCRPAKNSRVSVSSGFNSRSRATSTW